jgi:hypothetical protein
VGGGVGRGAPVGTDGGTIDGTVVIVGAFTQPFPFLTSPMGH